MNTHFTLFVTWHCPSPVVVDTLPGLMTVIEIHGFDGVWRIGAQALPVHDAFVAEDESFHARDAVICRCDGESKSLP